MVNNERCRDINNFYKEAAPSFLEWSPDPKRIGLYTMHIGYQNWQEPVSNLVSTLQMSQRIIELSEIRPGHVVLDAGCGVGTLAFEVGNIEPKARVFGIDLSENHIHLASKYNEHTKLYDPTFSVQDYEHLAFRNGTFDRIIFCESFIHSQDKTSLIQESERALKPRGKITIADVFMHIDVLTREEINIIEGLKTRMYIPGITHIQELITLLSINGFSYIDPRNITENVIAPTEYYPPKEQKFDEENLPQNMETLLIGLQNLLRREKAGYYILTAQKN